MSGSAQLYPTNGPSSVGMKAFQIFAAFVLLSASPPKPISLSPPQVPVPASLFGMHIHHMVSPNGADPLTPWPNVRVPEWRLWDARVTWPDLEPSKGEWRFDNLDRSLALAEAHHAGVLFTLGLTPRWASARPQEPSGYAPGYAAEPKDIGDWRTFVRTVATRYKGRIHAYEIWNEPNVRRFWTGDIDQLVALTREASTIIHGIDPEAVVVSPPATGFPGITWLPEFLNKGGSRYVDVIGYHFYPAAKPPEALLQLVDAIKRVMEENGVQDKPLWDTEAGWLPPTQIEPAELGAAYLARSYIILWADGVQRFYWYAWDNHTTVALRTTEQDSQTLTQAGRAYSTIQNWLVGARMDWCKTDSQQTWQCQLNRNGSPEWIVWHPDGTETFSPPKSWNVKTVTQLLGESQKLSGSGVNLGPTPVLMTASAR
jgi:Glycosyl hydrolases family 39